MAQEVAELIEAIKSLKSESDFVKDYLIPMITPFVSAGLGFWVASSTFKWQKKRERMDANVKGANHVILSCQSGLQNLMAIKSHYQGELEPEPLQRVGAIPVILGEFRKVDFDVSSVLFTLPEKEGSDNSTWRQVPFVQLMFDNYNTLIDMWGARNADFLKVQSLLEVNGCDLATVTNEEIIKVIGQAQNGKLVDLTQQCVALTDVLIEVFVRCIEEYPGVIKDILENKAERNRILTIKLNQHHEMARKPEVEVDFASLAEFVNQSEVACRARHNIGFDDFKLQN